MGYKVTYKEDEEACFLSIEIKRVSKNWDFLLLSEAINEFLFLMDESRVLTQEEMDSWA